MTGVYGGYFGAGSGVMMMAVLGLGTDLEFRIVNALKTLAVVASNVVATVIFLFVAELDWRAIVLLAVRLRRRGVRRRAGRPAAAAHPAADRRGDHRRRRRRADAVLRRGAGRAELLAGPDQ